MTTSRSRSLPRAVAAARLVLCAALASIGAAQVPGLFESDPRGIEQRLDAWREQHGGAWRMTLDAETGYAKFLYGGRAAAPFVPARDEDYFVLARVALADTLPLHGVDLDTLVEDAVLLLPLGNAGTTDKFTVRFHQAVGGVRVLGGFVNVLFDTSGRLLSIDVTGLPALSGQPLSPTVAAERALASVSAKFVAQAGAAPTLTTQPELVFDQVSELGHREPRLAWYVEAYRDESADGPQGFAYTVNASSGEVIRSEPRVHAFDVSGTVRSRATPGLKPDTAANPETLQAMPHIFVVAGLAGTQTTDANGNFTFHGVNPPLQVSVVYEGPHCNTANLASVEYGIIQVLGASSGNIIDMNPSSNTFFTAEANAFLWVNKLRDWVRSVNPSDGTADQQFAANTNYPFVTCNAFAFAGSVNFFQAGSCIGGGSAVNTAYSTVVAHEAGHLLNQRYGSGNGPDGFGEGNADVFAMYLTDQPLNGQDFFGPGTSVRTGLNNTQFCGDCCGGCHNPGPPTFAPHPDGEVLMGALWKVRVRLKASYGTSSGGSIADHLFNAWMNAFDDGQIKTIIETHWLTLDDDDGNLANGTPHFSEIDCGFRDQGFPGQDFLLGVAIADLINVSAPWNGTPNDPFRRIFDAGCGSGGALPHVAAGGTLSIAPGVYTEGAHVINQSVTLSAPSGGVTIR